MNFGKQMRTLRTVRDMSQQNLADRINLSRTYVAAIEAGTLRPSTEIEVLIRKALDWPEDAEAAFAILSPISEAS